MEYKEAPCIQNADRNVVFPIITWFTKTKFLEHLREARPIFPFLEQDEDTENTDNQKASSVVNQHRRVYVGKSIQSNLADGVGYGHDHLSNKSINLEVIGSVVCDLTGQWSLQIPHRSTVTEVRSEFLVLCVDDPCALEWVRTSRGHLPRYALKACIDRLTNEYFYIGKFHTHHHDQTSDHDRKITERIGEPQKIESSLKEDRRGSFWPEDIDESYCIGDDENKHEEEYVPNECPKPEYRSSYGWNQFTEQVLNYFIYCTMIHIN
jgi:hypothetical protein